jgi:hypothetical protein
MKHILSIIAVLVLIACDREPSQTNSRQVLIEVLSAIIDGYLVYPPAGHYYNSDRSLIPSALESKAP